MLLGVPGSGVHPWLVRAQSWTHMDKVVGICVLLGGKVVQVSQVLVLGDRERRAYGSQVGAEGKPRLRAVSDMPKLYVQDPSQLSAKICIWGQLTGNPSSSRGAFTASRPSFHGYILLAQYLVLCTIHAFTIHSFTHLQIHQDPVSRAGVMCTVYTEEATG